MENKSIFQELTGYRFKVEKDGKEVLNVPGILCIPGVLVAPKMSLLGAIAAPLLGCNIHLENENGKDVDIGKAVQQAAETVMDTAKTAARTVKEELDKAWESVSADDPEEDTEGTAEEQTDDVPTVEVESDDSKEE